MAQKKQLFRRNYSQKVDMTLIGTSILLEDVVFCYINCSDSSSDRVNFLKFEAEGQEFANFLRSLEQFIGTVKNQNNFG